MLGTSLDPVTGLADNASFGGALGATDDTVASSLFLVDLDGFGLVNRAHGHDVGDRYLRKAAAVLSKITRGDDFIARIDNDRFAVISARCTEQVAPSIARRIKRMLFAEGIRACVGHATAMPGTPLAETLTAAEASLGQRKAGVPTT